MTFIDFAELKQKVTIIQVAEMLGLKLTQSGTQLRGCCPIHNGNQDRQFVITPEKGVWFCFGQECNRGGDLIELVARVQKVSQKEAALAIARHFNLVPNTSPERSRNTSKALDPLPYLETEHELLDSLGIKSNTLKHFGAGYAPKGIMRGRLAIPIREESGVLVAYCGRAVRDEEPKLIFPKDYLPGLFNLDRIQEGTLYLTRDPLSVLSAYENGIENVAAFLGEITPNLLGQLANQAKAKGVKIVELF
jgi:DNA primase